MGIGSGSRDTVNVARLHEFMDRERLAAVVARSGQNLTYLSGLAYPGTLARHVDIADSTRAVILLWPRHGDPVIVLNAIAEKLTVRDSWVKRVSVYDAYNESPYARLCEVIKEAGLEGERIGFEKNYLSAEHWEEVRRGLPRVEMVDCNRMMDAVRWVKTPAELALLRKGADLLDDAYARYHDAYVKIIDACRPGVTAGGVYDFAVETFAKLGWQYTSILVGHSVGAWWHQQEPIVARGRDLTLEEGMVLALEPHGLNPGPGFLHLQDMAVVRRTGPELLSAKFPTKEIFVIE